MAINRISDLNVINRFPAAAKVRGQESVFQSVWPASFCIADCKFTALLVLEEVLLIVIGPSTNDFLNGVWIPDVTCHSQIDLSPVCDALLTEVRNRMKAMLAGRIASIMSILMYVSYIPLIINNLHGQYGDPIQPLVASIDSSFWCSYALLQKYKDWPVFIANVPGIIFGLITFVTALH